MNKQYAIFDMDGTLIDSMKYWKQLAHEFLLKKGITHIPEDILETIKSMTISESAALFVSKFSFPETPKQIASEMNTLMNDHYYHDIPLKEGVKDYLEMLHQKGVIMCVASATTHPLMDACLTRLNVKQYFQFLLSCESVGVGKHEPTVYLEAVKKLNATVSDTVIYEDALYAIETAKKAGFSVIGVYDESANHHWPKIKELSDKTIDDYKGEVYEC